MGNSLAWSKMRIFRNAIETTFRNKDELDSHQTTIPPNMGRVWKNKYIYVYNGK